MRRQRPGHNGRYNAYQRAFRAGYYGETIESAGVRLTAQAREAYEAGKSRRRATDLWRNADSAR